MLNISFYGLLTIITKYQEHKPSLQLSFYCYHIPSHILEYRIDLKCLYTGHGSLDLIDAITSFINVSTVFVLVNSQ